MDGVLEALYEVIGAEDDKLRKEELEGWLDMLLFKPVLEKMEARPWPPGLRPACSAMLLTRRAGIWPQRAQHTCEQPSPFC